MPIKSQVSPDGTTFVVELIDTFNFEHKTEFEQLFTTIPESVQHYTINLQQLERLDSTGLGGLLKAKLLADDKGASFNLVVGNDSSIKKMLSVAQLDAYIVNR